MSRFLSKRYHDLEPYAPGEQPKGRYIKLNANETSCPPSPAVLKALHSARMNGLGRYTDPSSRELKRALASHYEVKTDEVFVGNGCDEILGFIYLTFFEGARVCFPDITYNFYQTLAQTFSVDYKEIPLKADFTVNAKAFAETDRHIVLPNPNAPTGYVLPVSTIEKIVAAHPERLVVIDEAYVDFGNESCVPLVHKYDNLIVIHTMSKSRNLAGAHIGYCFANAALIRDLESMKGSFNPFNLNDINLAIGTAAVNDTEYLKKSVEAVIAARDYATAELRKMDFYVLESHANFIFVSHPWLSAPEYQAELRRYGILTRYYKDPERIRNFLRITIGTMEEMQAVIAATSEILLRAAA